MSFTPKLSTTLLLLTVVLVLLPVETYAFGAGDIPDFSYLNDKAYRHGDIESILETLVKSAGGAAGGGGLLGFAHAIVTNVAGGAKFSKSDIKKVYFGNWLRDYSQAMDIAGLTKLTPDSIILIMSILGFMTFGFATEEFEVTADRLGVYLPVEHIDNPKGYAAAEGDARQVHPKLRPPVDDRELEIDERTGMKNYMASEGQGWDTSTDFIRRTFRACIDAGRRAGGREGADLWEAYRLMGTGMHTMEDLLAHSNWCEIALRKMGHEEVFCHVGDEVVINTPNGQAPPLVTGSFGGADFIHSLMGEATDKLSQSSVTDLTQKMNDASQGDDNAQVIKDILSKLPIGGGDDKMSQGEQMQEQSKAYHVDPDNIAPPEVQRQLLDLLKWRDGVYRDVVKTIEMVPGLEDLLDQLSLALNAYVYTIISPYVVPILQQATTVLGEGSKAVIDTEEQYEVFDNPRASDPTHSFLAKDHFGLILNEPAGKIAQIVVENTVNLLVPAWGDNSDPNQVIDQILEAFHHPYYATGQSRIQQLMFGHMEKWLGGLGSEETRTIIQALTKESVRNGTNKRPGSEEGTGSGSGGHSHSATSGGYGRQQRQDQYGGGQGGDSRTGSSYGQNQGGYDGGRRTKDSSYGGGNYGGESQSTAGRYGQEESSHPRRGEEYTQRSTYGESQRGSEFGSGRSDNDYGSSGRQPAYQATGGSYGQSDSYGERTTQPSRESRREDQFGSSGYGGTDESSGRGGNEYGSSGYGRSEIRSEGGGYTGGSGRGENEYGSSGQGRGGRSDDYGGQQQRNEDSYGASGYGGEERRSQGHGSRGYESNRNEETYGSSRGEGGNSSSGYGQSEGYEGRSGNEERSYGSSGRGGNEYGSSGYSGSSGYAPSYGGGETFGAERLNISGGDRDDSEDGERHGRHGRRHRKHDSDD